MSVRRLHGVQQLDGYQAIDEDGAALIGVISALESCPPVKESCFPTQVSGRAAMPLNRNNMAQWWIDGWEKLIIITTSQWKPIRNQDWWKELSQMLGHYQCTAVRLPFGMYLLKSIGLAKLEEYIKLIKEKNKVAEQWEDEKAKKAGEEKKVLEEEKKVLEEEKKVLEEEKKVEEEDDKGGPDVESD
ncbi:hypothetical protein QC762_502705 [Podospora pseudocomata]|uniref:Uncharacterized protein n=1 Tax=Podospora pseudocomata TaxID=2093779 RepID=A0ABR0G9Y7_9PEZI|nr:hypothetical protein QC762_502705 [Podospora pseudocomata]